MDTLQYIKHHFSETSTVYHTIGSDTANGILGCGFMRKPNFQYNNLDSIFQYYSGVLLLDGQGTYIHEDGTKIGLTPGCFVQRIPGRRHSTIVIPDGKWLEAFVCLGKGLYHSLDEIGLVQRNKAVLFPGLDSLLIKGILTLYNGLKETSFYRLPYHLIRVQEIIFLVHELDAKNTGENTFSLMEHACKIIDTNICDNITSHEVAKRLNVSYESFRKLFKAKKGMSPHNYIIKKRIDTAKSMLLTNGKSVGEVALELGYCDSFSFSKQFKKVEGMSPSQFKDSH